MATNIFLITGEKTKKKPKKNSEKKYHARRDRSYRIKENRCATEGREMVPVSRKTAVPINPS